MRLARWLKRHPLDAFVLGLAAAQLLEAGTTAVPGGKVAVSVATLLWTLPLLWRRRFPFGAPAFAFAVQIATSFLDSEAFGSTATGLLALLLTFWVVGAENTARPAFAGAAIGCATVAVVALRDNRVGADDAIFVAALGSGVTLLAFATRRRATRAAELEARADRLDREREAEAHAAVAVEQAHIGRDVYNVVAQGLEAMTAQAAVARVRIDSHAAGARESILAVEETGRRTLGDLRRLLGILHEQPDDALLAPQPGLGDLDALVERAQTAGLPVQLTVEGASADTPRGIDVAAYRIVQEALVDALERAGPTSAQVAVRVGPDSIAVQVTDDGRHRQDANDADALVAMRERVALYGGKLETGPAAGGDYAVTVTLPLGTAAS